MISMKERNFHNYKSYAVATMDDIFIALNKDRGGVTL